MPLRVWPLGSSVIEKDIHHFSHPVAYLKSTSGQWSMAPKSSCHGRFISWQFYLSIEQLNKWNWYCTDCWDWGWCVPANQNWSWHVMSVMTGLCLSPLKSWPKLKTTWSHPSPIKGLYSNHKRSIPVQSIHPPQHPMFQSNGIWHQSSKVGIWWNIRTWCKSASLRCQGILQNLGWTTRARHMFEDINEDPFPEACNLFVMIETTSKKVPFLPCLEFHTSKSKIIPSHLIIYVHLSNRRASENRALPQRKSCTPGPIAHTRQW